MRMTTRIAGVVASTACAVGLMGSMAFAAPSHHHDGQWGDNVGNVSILSGNSIDMPIAIPVNICGNAIAILGFAEAGCQGGANVWLNNG